MSKEKRKTETGRLPLLPLRGLLVFPNTVVTIDVALYRDGHLDPEQVALLKQIRI